MNTKYAAPELMKHTFRTRSVLVRINRTAFALGKRLYSTWYFIHVDNPSLCNKSKLHRKLSWSTRSNTDGGGAFNPSTTSDTSNGTRLNRAIQAIKIDLSSKFKEIRKHFAMKLLFFLVGFYCSTAFATVIGQTGDWDILSAALAVFVVEGIGALMYKGSVPILKKFRKLISMFNYWKAGLCLGLFLDSFKYEVDDIFGVEKLWNFNFNMFSVLF